MYGKVDGLARIHLEPTVPAGVIRLPHGELLTRKFLSVLLDESHNGLGGGKKDLPGLSAMFMGRDKLVNPGPDLAAIRNSPTNWNLRGRGERSGCQVALGVFWIRGGNKRKIPTKLQHGEDLISIKISLKGQSPSLEREGRTRQRDSEAVHIGR